MEEIERKLLNVGYGIYSVDYTKYFSGTLDRETWLIIFSQSVILRIDETETKYTNQSCILENTRPTVSKMSNLFVIHVKSVSAFTMSMKYYNKIVSNFEAGDVQQI